MAEHPGTRCSSAGTIWHPSAPPSLETAARRAISAAAGSSPSSAATSPVVATSTGRWEGSGVREVLQELLRWWETGATAGLATVVRTWQAAPRQPGAAVLVAPDETPGGSGSGGCVEADVYAVAQEAAADGIPVLRRYGVSDADAMAVGLPCGGVLDVFLEPVSRRQFPELAELTAAVAEGQPVALATVLEHPDPERV